MISVAVVEDQAQYQRAIHAALEGSFCFEIVSQCQTGQEMLLWLRRNTVDILVVDLGLPDMSGVEVISFAQSCQAAKHIIVCSLFDDDAHLFDSIAAGATGYILKERLNSMLPDALRELYDGGSPMSPSIARRVLVAACSLQIGRASCRERV